MASAKKGIEVSDGGKLWGVVPASVRQTIGPIFLMAVPPYFVLVLWHTMCKLDGSFLRLYHEISAGGLQYMIDLCPSPVDPEAWKLISAYGAFELVLMMALPGKLFRANATATGHVPVYKANGMFAYLVTLGTLVFLTHTGRFNPSVVYDRLGEILSGLSASSLLVCVFLYIKGLVAPSTEDCGSNGGIIQDIFWGTELYPRIFGADVKMFTNCRFGMMYWAVGSVCYAYKQAELEGSLSNSMAVSLALQLVYITKFFHWEMGYMNSMDIQHDRAGFYLCWGCLVWVPAVYASPCMYLVAHPTDLGMPLALTIFVCGLICIFTNYDADRQRHHFRQMKGKCNIWGKPVEYITATYVNNKGTASTSLLLCSGWWGVSRHFHYIPEIMGAFFWSSPALFENVSAYFYVMFLIPLLLDRAFRDDVRCRRKYNADWVKYCARVPYKIIPGVV
ncbi:unnamed protein product [Discosporangium mesarthrocarpum]